ncbi:hypothetical protein Gotur_035714 [Gossypium turneri]
MTARAHQQHPHNHRAQHLKRRHLHHSPFGLCQVHILALICILTLIVSFSQSYATLECMAWCISFLDDSDSTDGI